VRTALLDANVLHPMVLCDLLIRLALSGFYRPLWSDEILHEVVRSIHGRRPDLSLELLQKRVEKMKRVLPDATVSGYERLLPDLAMLGSDAHVLAAAAEGGANVIVTFNTTDFAAAIRSRYVDSIAPVHPPRAHQPARNASTCCAASAVTMRSMMSAHVVSAALFSAS
jgi:predicted nucleic acid-binding protein